MAAFTVATAEARAKLLVANHTWLNAHYERTFSGTIAVRVQRYMTPTNPDYGAWVDITDDGTS